MEVVTAESQEDFIQRLGIILLNCIACQVDGEEKLTFGELGAVEVGRGEREREREREREKRESNPTSFILSFN